MITLHPLFAYVDPGSGLMALQLISAVVIGVGFYFRKVRVWIWNLFKFRRKKGDASDKPNQADPH